MSKVKIGVFGAFRGLTMINVLARHPNAELVAICDKYEPSLEQCKRVAAETGSKIALYTDFEEFFKQDMDAVMLANYANEHAPYAIRLLKSGRHVCSEVLPTQNLAEAVALVEAVEESGKVYAYAENYCYFPATAEMRRLYQAGELGEFVHGEGEYVHDCESIWIDKTYGERNHWRNRMYSTYYCTHSVGPLIHITGLRPKTIVGFETPPAQRMMDLGCGYGESGMILMQMENGATIKSLEGNLQREPHSIWYSLYGSKGMAESDRFGGTIDRINVYRKGDPLAKTNLSYTPQPADQSELAKQTIGHGGSDFYTMHYFIQKILGNPEGDACIDVYEALDMSIPGILAYRSICNGNQPMEMPDFRKKEDRDRYREDTWCTDEKAANGQLAPIHSTHQEEIPEAVYENARKIWEERQKGKNG